MKKVILWIAYFICSVNTYSQENITVHPFYAPDAKYIAQSDYKLDLKMKITSDSAVLNELNKMNSPNPLSAHVDISSEITINTQKEVNGKFKVDAKNNYHSFSQMFNGKKDSSNKTILMYGTAFTNQLPKYDSVEILPQTLLNDSTKRLLIKMFQLSSNNILVSNKKIQIGDTAIMNMKLPLQLPMGFNESISIKEVFKLVKIENGLAEFDIVVDGTFDILGNSQIKLQGKGSCDGYGKCSYNVEKNFFRHFISDIHFSMPASMNIDDSNKMDINVEGLMHSILNTTYQPNQ